MVGTTYMEVQRIAVGINHEMPFEPINLMFSGVSYLMFRPLFDLMTDAS